MAKFTGAESPDSDKDAMLRIRKKHPERWSHTKDLKYHGPKFKVGMVFETAWAEIYAKDSETACNELSQTLKYLQEEYSLTFVVDEFYPEKESDGDIPKEKLDAEYKAREQLAYD